MRLHASKLIKVDPRDSELLKRHKILLMASGKRGYHGVGNNSYLINKQITDRSSQEVQIGNVLGQIPEGGQASVKELNPK